MIHLSLQKVNKISKSYFVAEESSVESVEDNFSEDDEEDSKEKKEPRFECKDDNDSVKSCKNSEERWLDFHYYALDMAAANIQYILQTYEKEMLELEPTLAFKILEKTI